MQYFQAAAAARSGPFPPDTPGMASQATAMPASALHLHPSGAFLSRRLTPSVRYVAVLVGHPDLLQRVLGELPRAGTLEQKLLVVQHPGGGVVAVPLPVAL